MNIPSNLVVISETDISKLTEEELTSIVYADWWLATNPRFGQAVCVEDTKLIGSTNFPSLEDEGFLIKDTEITPVLNELKKWDSERFYV